MTHHHHHHHDGNVLLLARLAHEAGAPLAFVEGLRRGGPAGTPSLVDRVEELLAVPAAAVDRLLVEARRCGALQHGRWTEQGAPATVAELSEAALRVELCARMTGWLLPAVGADGEPSPTYVLGDGLPSPGRMVRATERLQAYLGEHDRGEWVSPLEVAAAVADLVDAAVRYRSDLPAD